MSCINSVSAVSGDGDRLTEEVQEEEMGRFQLCPPVHPLPEEIKEVGF